MAALTLTPDELQALTGYKQPAAQLAELHRQGYWRARRAPITGRVILERAHYEAAALIHQQMLNAVQPYLATKARLMALAPTEVHVDQNGRLLAMPPKPPKGMESLMGDLDHLISELRAPYLAAIQTIYPQAIS